jgi:hypothetical protein
MRKSYGEVVQELADLDDKFLRFYLNWKKQNEIIEQYKEALMYIGSLKCKTIEDAGHAANSVLFKVQMESEEK